MNVVKYPNWFATYANVFFARHLLPLAGQSDLRFLQVGAFTGDATCWLLEHVLTGSNSLLVDVDTWEGSAEAIHERFDWTDVEKTYDDRTVEARHEGRLAKSKISSREFFAETGATKAFDFIYIDGDHTAVGVLEDAVAAVRALKPGGLLAFDDYLWSSGKGPLHNPGLAIDAVRLLYADRLELIDIGQQVWFRG